MFKAFRFAFIALIFGIGAIGFSYSIWSFFLAYQAKSWPSVSGEIISDACKVAGDRLLDRHVRYRYTVDSKSYLNDRDHFGLRIATNDCFAEFRAGQRVVVFYNPADPEDSALKPGEYHQSVFGALVGLVFIVFSFVAFRRERTAAAA